jgi:putative endonuclease
MNNKYYETGQGIIDKRTAKRILGDKGEQIATEFLMKRGYDIRDRNYLRKYGEIDIVAEKDGSYHFIEVKTVSCETISTVIHETKDRYRPEDNVHPWKLQRLSKMIQVYIVENKLWDIDWVVDVMTVYIDKKTGESTLEIIEDIVL